MSQIYQRALLLTLLLLAVAANAMALKRSFAITQYERVVWQRRQGLPTEGVTSIAQTLDGYIWLGTRDGLIRFDGVRFVLFDKKKVPALPQNNIENIYAGDDGSLWIAAGGIVQYKDGHFTAYTTQHGLTSSSILTVTRTSDGSIWAGTFNTGLIRFKDGKFTNYRSEHGIPGALVGTLFEDADKNLWISTSGGLARFSNETLTTFQTPGLPSTNIVSVTQDHDKTLWVGTHKGLGRWNGASFQTFTEKDGLPSLMIKALLTDRENNLWIGTPKGLARYQDGKFSTLTEADGLPSNDVKALLEDHEGNLWITTDGGGIIALRNSKVLNLGKPEGLLDGYTWSLAQTVDRSVLAGTDKGVYRLENNRFVPFLSDPKLSTSIVYSISAGRDGKLWIGTEDGTLYRLVGNKTQSWTNVKGGIGSVIEDDDGSLWIALIAGGVRRFSKGELTSPLEGILPSNIVFTMRKDRDGGLWIGNGTQGGLSRFKDGKLTTFTTKDGLSDDSVQNIHIDADGAMWIATANGLTRFRNGKFTIYNSSTGLFDDNLSKILETDDGHLWISCNRGIFRVSKKDLNDFADGKISSYSSTHFGASQGMRTELTNYSGDSSGLRTHDGRLWFPTVKGVVALDPNDLAINPHAPNVLIEEVFINRNPVSSTGGVEIPPGRGELEFHFTALSFVAPDKVRFKYKLEGFDPDWIDAGNARLAQYTNIPPGNYQFRVKAANNDGVWNESGAALAFYLRPYFYQTRKFYALTVIVLIGIAAIAYTARVRRLKKRADELEQKVAERTEALAKANRAKTKFLANMSHELRTPMNAVLGMTRLLLDTKQTREQRDLAETISASGKSLLTIIDDILDFSKLERSEITLGERPFVLREVVEEAIDIFRLTLAEKQIDLVYLQRNTPKMITGDAARLRQILINLISNALKFTRQGEILITATSQPLRAGWCNLEFSIADTGIGIPARHFETIFESFTQVDNSSTRVFQGSGLGLAICKRLVELMNGRIWVESELKRGSTFYFNIPVQVPGNQQRDGLVKDELEGKRILLINDNPHQAEMIKELGAEWGLVIEAPEDPADVHAPLRNNSFDAAVVDQSLRKLAPPDLPIILLTSSSNGHDSETVFEVSKPVHAAGLYDSLKQLLKLEPEELPGARYPLKILVADDNPINREIVVKTLQMMGYQPDEVVNGIEVIEAVKRSRYDIILIDLHMPEMDGLETGRQLKRLFQTGDGPRVIAMSASATHADQKRLSDAGMDDMISKPFTRNDLSALLIRWANFTPVASSDDVSAALESIRKGFGEAALREFVAIFLRDGPVRVNTIKQASRDADWPRVEIAAHELKGSCGSLGLKRLMNLCESVEQAAAHLEVPDTLIEELETEHSRVLSSMHYHVANSD